MQTPVEIDSQGLELGRSALEAIEQRVAEFEQRYGRITACRMVVKGPGEHHRKGLYDVKIQLALPDGREVNVSRTPDLDERYSDLKFAINDAFKRAWRQLQDQVRRMQGQIKQHEAAPLGSVSHLDASGAFGFIKAADGHDVYFHKNSVLDGAFDRLSIGSRVIYFEEAGEKGPQASTVKLFRKHSLRQ